MGKNFVLKDIKGRPGGYLAQGLGRLRCGLTGGRAGELTLVYADGGEAVRSVRPGAQGEWADDGRALLAAYAQCGEEVYFTCERAKRAWERRLDEQRMRQMHAERPQPAGEARAQPQTPNPQEQARPQREDDAARQTEENKTAPDPMAAEAEEGANESTGGTLWPQARWPAPPCWPGARYVSGRWQD